MMTASSPPRRRSVFRSRRCNRPSSTKGAERRHIGTCLLAKSDDCLPCEASHVRIAARPVAGPNFAFAVAIQEPPTG